MFGPIWPGAFYVRLKLLPGRQGSVILTNTSVNPIEREGVGASSSSQLCLVIYFLFNSFPAHSVCTELAACIHIFLKDSLKTITHLTAPKPGDGLTGVCLYSEQPLAGGKKNQNDWGQSITFMLKKKWLAAAWGFCIGCQFSSVTQCPTLCDHINCSTPGLPVHYQPSEFIQTHVHWVGDAFQPSHLLLSLFPPLIFPASGSFQMSQLFSLGGQSTGVSALASFLAKKPQGWSPSEWTGWISLQSKGLSVFPKTRMFSNEPALCIMW